MIASRIRTIATHLLPLLLSLLAVGTLPAQSIYNDRVLSALGLTEDEVARVLAVDRETTTRIRRLRADLDVEQAELARLLVDEQPNMRAVERNLRDSAEIEVQIRLLEIDRELAIRDIVGTERWSTILRTVRIRQAVQDRAADVAQSEAVQEGRERLAALQREIAERQQELLRAIRDGRTAANDPDLRRQLLELQREFQELQELIRERL